jgi:hypothetical protein
VEPTIQAPNAIDDTGVDASNVEQPESVKNACVNHWYGPVDDDIAKLEQASVW